MFHIHTTLENLQRPSLSEVGAAMVAISIITTLQHYVFPLSRDSHFNCL